MKIAVTGHTSGLGLAIYTHFQNSYHVVGFSRSNGFDIKDKIARQKILEFCEDFDIFVNNAYNNFDNSQLLLLEEIFTLWQDTDKTIVNISSRFTTGHNPYSKTKKDLDIFCENKLYSLPKIINIKPGLIDTPRVKYEKGMKLSTDQVIEVLKFSLNNNIRSVTFGL